jgi:flagellar biosynthetic protein FliR
MHFTGAEMSAMVGGYFWPLVRIAAMITAIPVFSSTFVPIRTRLILAIGFTIVIAPVIPPVPLIDAMSIPGVLLILQQIMIGIIMGFIFHLVFAVFTIGGQVIAMQMGLGFATMIDPVNGAQAPVLSMFFILLVTLLFFILDGHLAMIGLMAESFHSFPISTDFMEKQNFWNMASWASKMFSLAVLVSLPAVTSLLLINMSLGIIGRAAPQLNIFAVGFSITIAAGFYVIMVSLPVVVVQFENISLDAFSQIKDFVNIR